MKSFFAEQTTGHGQRIGQRLLHGLGEGHQRGFVEDVLRLARVIEFDVAMPSASTE
jgi:hypothetical protein